MNFSDKLLYVRQRLFETRNIIFTLVLIVLTMIILISISTTLTILSLKKAVNEDSIETRILILDENNNINEKELKNIKYIKNVVSEKFRHPIIAKTDEYTSNYASSELVLNPLLYKEEIKITNGKNIENDGEIIIPSKFYPYNYYSNELRKNKLNEDLIIDGKKLIGRNITIQIPYVIYDKETNKVIDEIKIKEFKVVGTYDSKTIMENQNSCFISMNDFDNYSPNFGGYTAHEDENGNLIIDNIDEYNDLMVIIDNGKNIKYVEKILSDKKISYYCPFEWNEGVIKLLTLGPLLVLIIVIIICLAILSNFTIKKMVNRNKNYGILKSLGYSNSLIMQLETLENYILIVASYIIVFIIYCIAIPILKTSILYPLVIDNVDIKYPIFTYALTMLFILLYNKITINRKVSLYLKSDINVILKEN